MNFRILQYSLFPAYAGVIPQIKAITHSWEPIPCIRRGDPARLSLDPAVRLFPAYAGVILAGHYRQGCNSAVPRIRGGNPTA